MQKFHRPQKKIRALIGNETAEKDERFVANDVGEQTKYPVIVRIADDTSRNLNVIENRLADCDVRYSMQQRKFQPIVPTYLASDISQPCLMNNDYAFSQQQCRDQAAQADIVLKQKIAPTEKLHQFRKRWLPGDSIVLTGGWTLNVER